MAYLKNIVCLANSRKHSGRCVAGKELGGERFGEWIRPVSGRPEEDFKFQLGGKEPRLLDILSIPLLEPHPEGHQTENHRVAPDRPWKTLGRASWEALAALEDRVEGLWIDGSSSGHGLNDRAPVEEVVGLRNSLYLIGAEDLEVTLKQERDVLPKVRVRFEYNSVEYRLAVTDTFMECRLIERGMTVCKIPRAYLCISLSVPFEGFCYKLAAAIITPKRAQ